MKKFICLFLAVILIFSMCACASVETTTIGTDNPDTKISYVAEFYDNFGQEWMSVEGTSFNISPNKVKEYSYSSGGEWISSWTTSSVMTIQIDDSYIESCGSTVIFYDTRLEKIETEIPQDITLSDGSEYAVSTPTDINYNDMWSLRWWWDTHQQENTTTTSRAVIIQSQNGNPICMFTGNNVSWEVSANLPKTTELWIDGMPVYIHRANFAIVDLGVFK